MSGDWTVNASVTWQEGDNTEIRVYGLKPDGTLVEWVYSRRWHEPQALGVKATPDTPLSAIMFHNGDGVQIRVYYHSDGRVKELAYDRGWNVNAPVVLP